MSSNCMGNIDPITLTNGVPSCLSSTRGGARIMNNVEAFIANGLGLNLLPDGTYTALVLVLCALPQSPLLLI